MFVREINIFPSSQCLVRPPISLWILIASPTVPPCLGIALRVLCSILAKHNLRKEKLSTVTVIIRPACSKLCSVATCTTSRLKHLMASATAHSVHLCRQEQVIFGLKTIKQYMTFKSPNFNCYLRVTRC